MPAAVLVITEPPRPSRSEYIWLFVLVLSALIVRVWHFERIIVEHFDESVYAGNVWFTAEEGYQYPYREFYSPYYWPMVLEWSQIFCGVGKAYGTTIPPIFCGVATVASVWWIGRQWAGPVAGLTAAWLVACNDLHIAYSRTSLTDVPLTLVLVWAMHAVVRLLERPSLRTGVALGLWTGMAWSVKYSGWLPLAVLLAAVVPTGLMSGRPREWWRQAAIAVPTSILTAVVVWLPVLWDCQSVGGYAAVAANHAGYVRGWQHWGSGWERFAEHYGDYAWLMAAGWVGASEALKAETSRRCQLVVALGLSLQTLFLPQLSWGITIGLAGLVILLKLNEWRLGNLSRYEVTIGCVLSTWFLGLTLTTPLYTPYPRLMLPWWMAAVLVLAWGAVRWPGSIDAVTQPRRLSLPRQVPLLAVSLFAVAYLFPNTPCLLESRWSYWNAADRISVVVGRDRPIVQVYGLPAVVIGLRNCQVTAVVCGGAELAARVPEGWLVIESRAERDANWREGWAKVSDQFELVERIPVEPSSIVRFDRSDPELDPEEALLVYRRR